MKRIIFVFCSLFFMSLSVMAGITTYTFTSKTWASKIDATPCYGISDGWKCDSIASDYSDGRIYADGSLNSRGVAVQKSSSTAGATSVKEFTEVRRVTINFCQNSSRGKGIIHVQVGENAPQTITINKPASSGAGTLNHDSIINYSTPQTGKIKFWVDCTENAIYINTISIRSASGGSSSFTMDKYQLVTNVSQLEDSDQVILGVFKDGANYIMGYFDEYESVNNIHAIKGRYSADRNMVDPDDRAIYTLRITELNGHPAYIFQDELRYEEAYLVASGGQTKNRLALWNDVVSENYGNYGFWTIDISNGGEATITNLGNSKAKVIQYNAANTPTLFACYEASGSQTPVCLYRRTPATGDVAAIVAPFVNFGSTLQTSGKRTITVNANKLTKDITATLKKGEVFSLSSAIIDRDGDNLTISYNASAPGHYIDTLTLVSGETRTDVALLVTVQKQLTVAEAVHSEDHAIVYLKDVIVTKKYDKYIYVRDDTGSMLLFDHGEGDKRYGKDLDEGYLVKNATGRFINYYGVPEISLSEQFGFTKGSEVLPDPAPAIIDSIDVCRYLVLENAVVNSWKELTYKGRQYAIENKFNLASFVKDVPTRTFVIVSYDHDVVTLYIIKQEVASGLKCTETSPKARLIMCDGVLCVETENGLYTLQGEKVL